MLGHHSLSHKAQHIGSELVKVRPGSVVAAHICPVRTSAPFLPLPLPLPKLCGVLDPVCDSGPASRPQVPLVVATLCPLRRGPTSPLCGVWCW